MKLNFVRSMDEVLKIALEREVEPLVMPAPVAVSDALTRAPEEQITH
jgi:hypothetical protein